MYRDVVVERDGYTCELEEVEGELFLHLHIHNYSKEVHKELLQDWEDLQEALYLEGYDRIFGIPEKLGLVKELGWTHVDDIKFMGQTRGLYVWDLRHFRT